MSLRNHYNEHRVKRVGNLKRNEEARASVGSNKSRASSNNGDGKKKSIIKLDDNINVLTLRNSIGSKQRGQVTSYFKDDRTARVTLVRRMHFATPPNEIELNLAQKNRIAEYKELKSITEETRRVKPVFFSKPAQHKTDASPEARILADDRFLKRNRIRKMPQELMNGHTLQSINQDVLIRYHDRPEKLREHLPFGVSEQNYTLKFDAERHDTQRSIPVVNESLRYASTGAMAHDSHVHKIGGADISSSLVIRETNVDHVAEKAGDAHKHGHDHAQKHAQVAAEHNSKPLTRVKSALIRQPRNVAACSSKDV